jgi:hypothetical protein
VDEMPGSTASERLGVMCQQWLHSHEEDSPGVEVYRPRDFPFPRARGRAGLEFRPDGSFVRIAIGRGDAREPHEGRWAMADPEVVEVREPRGGQRLRIVSLESDRLVLAPE